jgi:hypothetical protein
MTSGTNPTKLSNTNALPQTYARRRGKLRQTAASEGAPQWDTDNLKEYSQLKYN